jgi:hypothetical protein
MNGSPATVTAEMLRGLPSSVRKHLEFSGVVGKPLVRTVTVKQTGKIRQSPEKPWMQFRATETFSSTLQVLSGLPRPTAEAFRFSPCETHTSKGTEACG